MKIFFSPFSPFVRKCLVVAHELGLGERIQLLSSNVNPIDRDQVVIVRNPLGKVPTFIADDGQVLYDSRVICEFLNMQGNGELFPPAGAARWSALTLQSLGDGILEAAVLARYEEALRPAELRWGDWRAGQLDKIETSLAHLDTHPQELPIDNVNIGNLTIACALWYLDLRFPDLGWRDRHSAVAQWYAVFSERASLQKTWSLAEDMAAKVGN